MIKLSFIHLAFLSALMVGCASKKSQPANQPPEIIRSVLMSAKSLKFEGSDIYTDGGSLGYEFVTDQNRILLIFIPVPDSTGRFLPVIDASQSVIIAPESSFSHKDTYELKHLSTEEIHFISLLTALSTETEGAELNKELLELIELINTRNYAWENHAPRFHISKNPKVYIDKSSIEDDVNLLLVAPRISNQQVDPIVTTPVLKAKSVSQAGQD